MSSRESRRIRRQEVARLIQHLVEEDAWAGTVDELAQLLEENPRIVYDAIDAGQGQRMFWPVMMRNGELIILRWDAPRPKPRVSVVIIPEGSNR
jgi:hypothetical protein